MSDLSSLPPDQQQVLLDGPALKPPVGVQSNFENPPNSNAIPEAVIPICLVLVSVAVLLRYYARAFVAKEIKVDDGMLHPRRRCPNIYDGSGGGRSLITHTEQFSLCSAWLAALP